MRHSLYGVADAVEISKGTLRNMKQNLFGAFIYNSLGIPLSLPVSYILLPVHLLNLWLRGTPWPYHQSLLSVMPTDYYVFKPKNSRN